MGSGPMAWIVQSTITLWIVGGGYRRYVDKIDSNTILLLSSIPCHWIGTMGRCQSWGDWKDTPMRCIHTLMHGILAERREYNFRETEAVLLSAYISGKDRIGQNPNQLKKRSMFRGRKQEMASVFRGNCPRSSDAYVGWLWYIDRTNVPETDHEPNSSDTFLL